MPGPGIIVKYFSACIYFIVALRQQVCFLLQVVLFIMCAGNELFFCMLYLIYFTSGPVCKYTYFIVVATPIKNSGSLFLYVLQLFFFFFARDLIHWVEERKTWNLKPKMHYST